MTTTPAVLIDSKQLENAETTQYTSNNVTTMIDKFVVSNTTAGAVTFSVKLVKSGDTAAATPATVPTRTVQAGKSDLCPEIVGQNLEPGDFIATTCSAATSLTCRASGRQYSS